MCRNYKSETGCIKGNKCQFRHVEAEEKPSKELKKGGAKRLIGVSQDTHPRRSIPRRQGKLGSNHTVKFSKSTWHKFKNVNLMSVILALPSLRRGRER